MSINVCVDSCLQICTVSCLKCCSFSHGRTRAQTIEYKHRYREDKDTHGLGELQCAYTYVHQNQHVIGQRGGNAKIGTHRLVVKKDTRTHTHAHSTQFDATKWLGRTAAKLEAGKLQLQHLGFPYPQLLRVHKPVWTSARCELQRSTIEKMN